MKNRHQSPNIWLFNRHDKQSHRFHSPSSTFQASQYKQSPKQNSRPCHNENQKQSFNKIPLTKGQVQTVSLLRKQLKSIKMQVNKLIQEGFVKTQIATDWLESSANLSSLSKSSKISSIVNTDLYTQSDGMSRKVQQSLSNFSNSLQQLNTLRQQHQKLKIIYKKQEQKQYQSGINERYLSQQIKALRKNKQQLTKCIQILQHSLRETNQQLKNYIGYSQKLQSQSHRLRNQCIIKQESLKNINSLRNRLEQELHYKKAENSQLIRIIQLKQEQVQDIKIHYSSQIRAMQIQYSRNASRKNGQFQSSFERRKIKSIDPREQPAFRKSQLDKLYLQNQNLRAELDNKQQLLQMMLNDIRSMDKQLRNFDIQHQELLRCRKLIQQLNERFMRAQAKRVSLKYKYC